MATANALFSSAFAALHGQKENTVPNMAEVVVVVVAVAFLVAAYIEDAGFKRRLRHSEYLHKITRRLDQGSW